MASRNKKPLKPIEVLVAFIMVFGLGYIFFSNFPRFFMWLLNNMANELSK